ncbi:13714_t:CDS:2, partial [Entrophospora sp. SA101]
TSSNSQNAIHSDKWEEWCQNFILFGANSKAAVEKLQACHNYIPELIHTYSSISSINTDTTVQFTETEFANNESVPIKEFQ